MEISLKNVYENFNMSIKSKSGAYSVVKKGKCEDIDNILNCYNTVWIDKNNVYEKINNNSKNSFYNSGGMFNKLTVNKVKAIIDSETDILLISSSENENKNINSLLWLSVDTDVYDNIEYYEHIGKELRAEIEEYKKNNQLIYPMDFIVLPGDCSRGIAYPFLCSAYERLYELGYKYAFVEIYTLMGYYDEKNSYVEVNAENRRSALLNIKIGAENIGNTKNHEYKIAGITVITKSEIYGLDLYTGISMMKEKINEKKNF